MLTYTSQGIDISFTFSTVSSCSIRSDIHCASFLYPFSMSQFFLINLIIEPASQIAFVSFFSSLHFTVHRLPTSDTKLSSCCLLKSVLKEDFPLQLDLHHFLVDRLLDITLYGASNVSFGISEKNTQPVLSSMTCRARFNSNLFINRFATNITAKRRFLIKDNWTSNCRGRIQFPFGFWQFFERWPEVPHFQQ